MRELAQLLNEMQSAGVIRNHAVFGATAQMRYTEPMATLDADVLVVLPSLDRLDVLSGIYEFCAAKGYRPEGEAIRAGAWPGRGGDSKRGSSMSEIERLLERQARWQRSRRALSWPEKIRMAEQIRASAELFRAGDPPEASRAGRQSPSLARPR